MLAKDLALRLGESCRISTTYFERRNYSRDLARVPPVLEKALHRTTPSLVVQPRSEQDIAKILAFCSSRGLALFPRGTGSFAFGGAVPTRNGVVLDLSPMMEICDVAPERMCVRVQPGARWADISEKLEYLGLAPVTTPTSLFSTVGGWIATGGMGLGSYAYGSVSESVLNVRVIRPDGSIEELGSQEESIKDFFGTEGQLGILTEITLRIRKKPEDSRTCMLAFGSPEEAVGFIERLADSDHHPSHVAYFDREYMRRENILFSSKLHSTDAIMPEQDVVLLHFETAAQERRFLSSANGSRAHIPENPSAKSYLWADRFFPLKAQRISPGLLGTEVVISGEKLPDYIQKIRRLGRHFGITPAIEGIACRNGKNRSYLVILSFHCDYLRRWHYLLSLLFIQMAVKIAVKKGGHPYGIGIWNTPFVASRFGKERLEHLKRKKRAIDPKNILNPDKFFRIKGRFSSLPAFLMRPAFFRTILNLSRLFTPFLGLTARFAGPDPAVGWEIPGKEDKKGKGFLLHCTQRCTGCGSCISVCPAYHITRDEKVSGRAKLRMAEAVMNGMKLEQTEAHAPFQCLHCGLCEEVCQTHLPLRDCYLILEEWIVNRFGLPTETIRRFTQELDNNRLIINRIFGLDLPEWSPDEQEGRILTVGEKADRGGP